MSHENRPQRELHAEPDQLDFSFMRGAEQAPMHAQSESLRTATRSIGELEAGDILLRDDAQWKVLSKVGGATNTTLTLKNVTRGAENEPEKLLSLPNDTELEVVL